MTSGGLLVAVAPKRAGEIDGRQVGRLDPLFKGLAHIKETQVVQVARDRLVVNIVPEAGYSQETGAMLMEALKVRVGQRMHIEMQFLSQIPRTSSGKFRAVVSELGRAATVLQAQVVSEAANG
jgi:phenylacetate-CoA ligase